MEQLNYQQLALKIIARIKNGSYAKTGKIESIRELSNKYKVGRQVATTAVKYLAKHNYIYSIHGSGTYINQSNIPGLFNRIAYFYAERNLAISSPLMLCLFDLATKNGFELIPGSNFEENYTFKEWFNQRNNFDGVIMNGNVSNSDLLYLKRHNIPYVVYGNHAISAEHPQVTLDIVTIMYEKFKRLFAQHQWKKVAFLSGPCNVRSYQEALDGFVKAQKSSNLEHSKERIICSSSNGVDELTSYFAKEIPDAIVILCDYWKGFQKYCQLHPEFKRPEVVISKIEQNRAPDDLYDWIIEDDTFEIAQTLAQRTISMLLEKIHSKIGKEK